jgi:hypothetical protein
MVVFPFFINAARIQKSGYKKRSFETFLFFAAVIAITDALYACSCTPGDMHFNRYWWRLFQPDPEAIKKRGVSLK